MRNLLRRVRGRLRGNYVDEGLLKDAPVIFAELFLPEPDLSVRESENRVVFAQADVFSRMPAGAALADDDVSGPDGLAPEYFDSKPFGL